VSRVRILTRRAVFLELIQLWWTCGHGSRLLGARDSLEDDARRNSCFKGVVVISIQNMSVQGKLKHVARDGNGYPKPETRWVKTLLGHGYDGFWYPWVFYWVICYAHRVWWAWVCSLLPHTRYPMGNLLIYDMWVRIYVSYKMNFLPMGKNPIRARVESMLCFVWFEGMILPFNVEYCWTCDKLCWVRYIYYVGTYFCDSNDHVYRNVNGYGYLMGTHYPWWVWVWRNFVPMMGSGYGYGSIFS
jgi:hypothetical protein